MYLSIKNEKENVNGANNEQQKWRGSKIEHENVEWIKGGITWYCLAVSNSKLDEG